MSTRRTNRNRVVAQGQKAVLEISSALQRVCSNREDEFSLVRIVRVGSSGESFGG